MKNLPDIPVCWLSLELTDGHGYEDCTAPASVACDPLLFYHQSEGNEESGTCKPRLPLPADGY
jgi:hypothetical protein